MSQDRDHSSTAAASAPAASKSVKRLPVSKLLAIALGFAFFLTLAAGVYLATQPKVLSRLSAFLGIESRRGWDALGKGDYPAAVKHLEAAVAANPNDYSSIGNLGIAYQYQGRFDEAVAMYKRAVNLQPSLRGNLVPSITSLLAWQSSISIGEQDIDKAEKYATEALVWNAQSWEAWSAQANVHLWRKRPMEAMEAFDKARGLATESEYTPAMRLYDQSNVEFCDGRFQDSLDHARQGLAITPPDHARFDPAIASALSHLAMEALSEKDIARASKLVEEALTYEENSGHALWVAGWLRMNQKRLEEALEMFEKAEIYYAPDKYTPEIRHYDFGTVHMKMKNFALAEPHFAAMVKLHPERPDLWMYYGECLRHGGKNEEAIAAYEQAALSPVHATNAKERIEFLRNEGK